MRSLILFCALAALLFNCAPLPELLPPADFATVDTLSLRTSTAADSAAFPERAIPRYNKALAVCISGGAGRAFGASLGQMAALEDLGVLDSVGIVSVLSGSSWSLVPWWYAPASFNSKTLRGPLVCAAPASLSPRDLRKKTKGSLAAAFTRLTYAGFIERIAQLKKTKACSNDRLYSWSLGDLLLHPFELFAYNSFIALDSNSARDIRARIPALDSAALTVPRPGLPLLIANAALVTTKPQKRFVWPFELSTIACGTPAPYSGVTAAGTPWPGRGYVETVGFNGSDSRSSADSLWITGRLSRYNRFLLADMVGSSGAAPASVAAWLGLGEWFPQFTVNAIEEPSPEKSALFTMGDGGDVDDAGILCLLARGQKHIIAFVNAQHPLGDTTPTCCEGIDPMISRLYGHYPPKELINPFRAPVFEDNGAFAALSAGLKMSKDSGGNTVPHFRGSYRILANNVFGIPPMGGDGTVDILWIYNDCNTLWKNSLPADTRALFADPDMHLGNFPNLKTVFNNSPEMFWYSPTQLNLLANMWYSSLKEGTELGREMREMANLDRD